jgi:FMN phosphatase YigB (HAD superfamily)
MDSVPMDSAEPPPGLETGGDDPVRRDALRRRDAVQAHRALVLRSGLFDGDWYRRRNKDAAESDLEPLDHYFAHGIRRRAAPGPLFDSADYLRQAWHLRPGTDDPLSHFLLSGHAEGVRPRSVVEADATATERAVAPFMLLPKPSRQPSLAVVVHVFYLDLFDEICEALSRLPYRFDLLVSTDQPEKETLIRERVAAHRLDALLLVRVCDNRGRNFGPLLTVFREAIGAHDLLLHLHTKKSLHGGYEQQGWRQTMLRTLLPPMPATSGLIARFVDDPGLGVLTANPGDAVRYWAYGWLSNLALARPLYDRLGLTRPVPRGLFDYPLGGMFWARTAALARLLDHPWRIEDFPEELGQTDGTIQHAIERVIVSLAAEAGFGFAELDYERGLIRPGWASRNLDQYRLASASGLRDTLHRVGAVSFDLFDTLLTRSCLTPDAVHRFIGFAAARRFPGADDYVARRGAAETEARRARDDAGDVDLDEIHACFVRDAGPGWSEEAIAFVLHEEVVLDMRTLQPRAVMVEALEAARALGLRTLLTSDSYLTRRSFDAMLCRFGLEDHVDAVYLSSERRARKDRGDLWALVGREEDRAGLLHVGDNEQSDIQQTARAGIRHFHVFPPATLFAMHGLLPAVAPQPEQALGDDLLLGPIAAELFNSPFLDAKHSGPVLLSDPEQAGAVLLGPLLFAFVAWIASHPTARHLDRLFFVSREGWFLKRLYDAVIAASGRTDLPGSVYFHCSRRASLAASQGVAFDPDAVLRGAGFTGSLSDFFLARLGFVPDAALCHQHDRIRFPRDTELVRCMMELMRAPIVAHGKDMARGLAAYADSVGMDGAGPYGFVDVGYSGTMQTALQSVLETRLIGLYMGVSHDAAQVRAGGGHAFGAFADGNVADFTGGYGLMLEAFLTAPHGQVIGYDDERSPLRVRFRHDGLSQTMFPVLERFYQGAERYAVSLMRCWGPDLLAVPFRAEAATAMLEAVRRGRIRLGDDLMRALSVEDDFCGGGEIAVFHRLPGSADQAGS